MLYNEQLDDRVEEIQEEEEDGAELKSTHMPLWLWIVIGLCAVGALLLVLWAAGVFGSGSKKTDPKNNETINGPQKEASALGANNDTATVAENAPHVGKQHVVASTNDLSTGTRPDVVGKNDSIGASTQQEEHREPRKPAGLKATVSHYWGKLPRRVQQVTKWIFTLSGVALAAYCCNRVFGTPEETLCVDSMTAMSMGKPIICGAEPVNVSYVTMPLKVAIDGAFLVGGAAVAAVIKNRSDTDKARKFYYRESVSSRPKTVRLEEDPYQVVKNQTVHYTSGSQATVKTATLGQNIFREKPFYEGQTVFYRCGGKDIVIASDPDSPNVMCREHTSWSTVSIRRDELYHTKAEAQACTQ